ncbi:MAG: hypothetical protein L6Q83_11660, partial [Gammaproteobacteria bacterium]|nr:hypothetical protein [Gammaproteobacteria bacterium]
MIDNGVYTPAHVLASGIRSGSLSSAAVVGAAIARAREINPRLNAVIALDEAAAMQSARAADEAVRNGCEIGRLHGLPITIKDCFEVAGFAAVNGAPELQGYRPRTHAPAVQRIVDAGAIVIGKTNVPRYSLDLQTFNDVFGVTRNPWDPTRTPGGSCGGAAVALATGVTSLELGTDLAGSLRIPAHSTGVCSLKPSFGVVPVSGVLSNVPGLLRRPDLVVAGPMARTVADLELLLDVVAGPTAPDAAGWRLDLPPSRRQPGELRVAAWLDDDICPVEQGMAAVLDAACRALDEDGVAMDRDARPAFEASEYFRTYLQLMYAEMSAGFPESVFRAFAAAARRNAEHSGWTPLTLMPWAVTQG